jgi:hypothetical protein
MAKIRVTAIDDIQYLEDQPEEMEVGLFDVILLEGPMMRTGVKQTIAVHEDGLGWRIKSDETFIWSDLLIEVVP